MSAGFLVCKKCGGYYELQEGETPEDFEECQCGGRLVYSPVDPLESSEDESEYPYHESEYSYDDETEDETIEDHPLYNVDYTGQIKKFNNGKISFKFPSDWTVNIRVEDEKFEGKNTDETIKFTIYRKSELEYITFDELMEVWDDIFESQNIDLTYKGRGKKGNIETFLITGENSEKKNIVIIAGFKFFDFLYYFHFIISSSLKDKYMAATGLLIQSFQLNKLKHTIESF